MAERDPSAAELTAAVEQILATIDAQLADTATQAIVLTRDEALLTAGLLGSLPALLAPGTLLPANPRLPR